MEDEVNEEEKVEVVDPGDITTNDTVVQEDVAYTAPSLVQSLWTARNIRLLAVFFILVVAISVALVLLLAPPPVIRRYYISTEDVLWDYAPKGHDACTGAAFAYPANKFTDRRYGHTAGFDNRVGTKYWKARFVQYTDETFTVRSNRTAKWAHLGILGPVIRAETGDQIQVTFRNGARFPFSISPSGLSVTKSSEGSSYHDETTWIQDSLDNKLKAFGLRISTCQGFSASRGVRPCKPHKVLSGEQHTYVWNVPASAGPTDPSVSSTAWLYRSNSDPTGEGDMNAGLMGPIIITRRGESSSGTNLQPKDVTREFVVINHAVDENRSPYMRANVFEKITKPALQSPVPGQVSFGALDRARVLQALVAHASSGTSKISYSAAKAYVNQSTTTQEPVGVVVGRPILVRFDRDSFDPNAYDSANGGHGAAKAVLEKLVETIINEEGPGFVESNMMHAINGYVYCNQPGLTMDQGDRVRWYIIAVGSDVDIHTPHWHGHTVLANGHRYDEVDIVPNVVVNADMHTENPGTWLFHCHVNDHIKAGMSSLYTVAPKASGSKAFTAASVREYFIAAEEVEWDYLPGGQDMCGGQPASSNVVSKYFNNGGHDSLGGRNVTKARYVEYTDATFKIKKNGIAQHMGILGPVVRAEVGDRIKIIFRNKARYPFSMHAHGVFYSKDAEGADYNDGTQGSEKADDSIGPNGTFTYVWDVPEDAGPGPNDLSSKLWMYHSHVSEVNDTNAGLIGPIVITKRGMADNGLKPKDVNKEVFLLFSVLDEAKSRYLIPNLNERIKTLASAQGGKTEVSQLTPAAKSSALFRLSKHPIFKKYAKKHVINGHALCTLPGLDDFKEGEKVRWNLIAIGDEIDLHTAAFEGHGIVYEGERGGVVPLLPSSMTSVDTVMKPGDWNLFDAAADHYTYGAKHKFKVSGKAAAPPVLADDKVSRYYIAADEIEWDYAPKGKNMCSNSKFTDEEAVYTAHGDHRIGTTYIKALYREYNSEKFDTLRYGAESRFNPASGHLGLLGPIIKASVGENIEIIFRNNLGEDASLVPLGGPLVPMNIEALNDIQKKRQRSGEKYLVVPGGEIKMTIHVGESAGPVGKKNSVSYIYASNVNLVRDINSGLLGLIIIHGKDAGSRKGSPKGVHREIVALFNTFDENLSRYARINALKYAKNGETIDVRDVEYKESNRKRTINGFMHCNSPYATVKQHQSVRWYIAGLGSSTGLHGPYISGYSYQSSANQAHNVALIGPGMTRTVDVNATNFGKWLVRDAVLAHQHAGMSMFFDVKQVLHPGA